MQDLANSIDLDARVVGETASCVDTKSFTSKASFLQSPHLTQKANEKSPANKVKRPRR